jgi:hypothetical protein
MRDQPVVRPLPANRTTRTQNKCMQISMPLVGFEPTIPAFERVKTVHALGGVATVIAQMKTTKGKFKQFLLIRIKKRVYILRTLFSFIFCHVALDGKREEKAGHHEYCSLLYFRNTMSTRNITLRSTNASARKQNLFESLYQLFFVY